MIPVTLMMAVTIDGKIAKSANHFTDWTCKEDKTLFRATAKEFGMIIVGKKTYDTFPGPLPDKLNVVFTRQEGLKEIEGVKWVKGDPRDVLKELEDMGFKKALLTGGASLNSVFIEHKLIDEIILTIEPKIFGEGISLFSKEIDIDLELKSVEKLGEDSLVVRYKVKY